MQTASLSRRAIVTPYLVSAGHSVRPEPAQVTRSPGRVNGSPASKTPRQPWLTQTASRSKPQVRPWMQGLLEICCTRRAPGDKVDGYHGRERDEKERHRERQLSAARH